MVEMTLQACIKSDADDKDVIEILKNIDILKTEKFTDEKHKDDWFNDWTSGHETAKEEIKEFCKDQQNKYDAKEDHYWNMGYVSALIDVIEFIERI